MTPDSRRALAVGIWIGSLVLVCATVIIQISGVFAVRWYAYVIESSTGGLLFPPLGALIVRRYPGHWVGWLLLVPLGALGAVQTVIGQTAHWIGGPTGGALAVSSEAIRLTGFTGLGILLLIYPTGRLISRRWRWAVVACVCLLFSSLSSLIAPLDTLEFSPLRNPIHSASLQGTADFLETLSSIAMVGILAGVVSLFVRFRRARSIERQQIKLFALAAAASFVLIVAANVTFPGPMEEGWLGYVVWNIPLVALPAAASTAILRHGLYDIDRVISRTLGYAVITAVLGGVFVLVAIAPAALVGSEDSPDWVIAVATLLIVALFRPVRRRVRNAVDRRFNRSRYDAARTIEAFNAHLREEVDLDALQAELRAVVARTMQPAHVSLWVKEAP